MTIASAVIAASIRNNSNRKSLSSAPRSPDKKTSLINGISLNTQWLRQSPKGLLEHINAPLLKEIDSQIKQISKKELHEAELNKSYQILTQCLSNYQVEAETIYSARKNLKSNALFCTLVLLGLLLIICIPISVVYPLMLPVTLALTLILVSFVSIANSNSGFHNKHPANEIELNLHFKNFMYALEKYKNRPDNNSEANFQQSPENTAPHSNNPGLNINAASLNCNAALFKLANPQEEQSIVKRDVSCLKPQQLL